MPTVVKGRPLGRLEARTEGHDRELGELRPKLAALEARADSPAGAR